MDVINSLSTRAGGNSSIEYVKDSLVGSGAVERLGALSAFPNLSHLSLTLWVLPSCSVQQYWDAEEIHNLIATSLSTLPSLRSLEITNNKRQWRTINNPKADVQPESDGDAILVSPL
jgi:hypothetical protein